MFVCLFLLFVSCGDSQFEFSSRRAYFVFDNSQHLDPTLSSAMNPLAPGIFCRVATSGSGRLLFESNQGQTSEATMNAIDQKRTLLLGIYNESGLIVGYGNMTNPPVFYAYDAQCPNCYAETSMPRQRLSMSSDGRATCQRCGRSYDMNSGGIVANGPGGDKLERYRAQTTGPSGVLTVGN